MLVAPLNAVPLAHTPASTAHKRRGSTEEVVTEMKVVVIFLEEFFEGGRVRPSKGFPELPRAEREPARCWRINIATLSDLDRLSKK